MDTTCSRCDNESEHSVLIRRKDPAPLPNMKDIRGIDVIRFCDTHWPEVESFLRPKK